MPYLLFLKKRQHLKLSFGANYRWRFKGERDAKWPSGRVLNLRSRSQKF